MSNNMNVSAQVMAKKDDRIISFYFSEQRFNYEIPISKLHDLVFLEARKAEVIDCLKQLSAKIGTLNIASKEGVFDLSMSAKVGVFYYTAYRDIQRSINLITGVEQAEPEARILTDEEQSKRAEYMYNETRERTR